MWEKNAVWPAPRLERIRPLFNFADLIDNLPEDMKIKCTALSDVEFLRVAFSILPTTKKAQSAPVYPFAFERLSINWARASSSPATNCIFLLRQLAATNVIERLWSDACKEAFRGKIIFQKMCSIKRLLMVVKENGTLVDKLCPVNLTPEFEKIVDALILMLTIDHITMWKTSQPVCAKHIRALVGLWSTLDGITGPVLEKYRKKLRKAVKDTLGMLIVHSALKWQTILGGGSVEDSSSALADAKNLATDQENIRTLAFLAGSISSNTPTPFSNAIRRDTPPTVNGDATTIGQITVSVDAVVGPLFPLQ